MQQCMMLNTRIVLQYCLHLSLQNLAHFSIFIAGFGMISFKIKITMNCWTWNKKQLLISSEIVTEDLHLELWWIWKLESWKIPSILRL